jgi:hypothetical protein
MGLTRRIDGNHDMTFGHGIADMAVDAEACAQNVKTRLLLLQQEWFLDTDAGVPWLQDIMVKPANLALAESIVKRTILETEGVSALRSFSMTFDRNTRRLTITAAVVNIYGSVANIKVTK